MAGGGIDPHRELVAGGAGSQRETGPCRRTLGSSCNGGIPTLKRSKLVLAAAAATFALTGAVAPMAFAAGAGTIHVPSDFVPGSSDTRATGHYQVVGTGLRVWTEGSTSTDKVAEYVATSTPLATAG